ncbi:hypothetical protein NONI108955_37960 [Nocardia ninae]|uniref:hypothetical protein n=1 Tax=Nocardia ninae TaxID=356145 RepID=UPI001649D6EF|nr:hypothetical protein [Nocardia ninae]
MIVLLADAGPARGTVFADYLGLLVPVGVVIAAIIAATVAVWNERGHPMIGSKH